MSNFKYFLADAVKQKAGLHHLDFIESFLQEKVKSRVFVNLDSIYADYFPDYPNYFGKALIWLKSMYVMTNYGKLFADELIDCLLEAGFIRSQQQMSIYYKYAPGGSKKVVLSYVNDFIYCYTSETLGKWFVDALEKMFHVNFLVYAHWFMSIIISLIKDHSISVDQARYDNYIVAKYLDNSTVKTSKKFYKATLTSDMIFTKTKIHSCR